MNRQLGSLTLAVVSLVALLCGSQAGAQLFPGNTGNSLGSSSDRPRPMPMDQAFPYFVSIVDDGTLTVTWQIAPDHYLYRHQFDFSLRLPGDETVETVEYRLPGGVAKHDQFFGDVEVYYDGVSASVAASGSALPAGTSLIIQYQGCAEWGFCYPPQSASYPLVP